MIQLPMSEKTDVPVSLVWRRTARPQSGVCRFPEEVLRDLEKHFNIHVSFTSPARPTVLAMIPEGTFDDVETFLEERYPAQIELGFFY